MRLDDYNLARCAKCNRLMEKRKDRVLCSRCLSESEDQNSTFNQESVKKEISGDLPKLKITTQTSESIPQTYLQKTVNQEDRVKEVSSEENLCSRCKAHPRLPRKELCLSCITDLYKSFQSASEEIAESEQQNPYEDLVLLQKTLSSARKLEPFKRIRTEGLLWIKRPK